MTTYQQKHSIQLHYKQELQTLLYETRLRKQTYSLALLWTALHV
jgi:hypothetical protein